MKKKIPTSSYRLQLSKHFCLNKATAILSYLKDLGIEMVYTSPYFEIASDTQNPYMIISHLKISSELGGEEAFISFCKECKRLSLLHMMDIVPNHMAVSNENIWWKDVVKNREQSKYAPFFDIDWQSNNGYLVLPGEIDIHSKINYRRFFDICEMVGINIEHDQLYKLFFSKITEYIDNDWVQGFRIDHIDGLKFPKVFLEQVNTDFPHLYIALEKIVQDGELIREDWKCDGSVGYELLFLIDQVLLDKKGEDIFSDMFMKFTEEKEISLSDIKISYLNHYLISEVNRFSNWFGVDKDQLLIFLANFPIYRSYADQEAMNSIDVESIEYAASFTSGDFFKKDIFKKEYRETLLKLQQILPAVFAKGFEDTYNYRYVRLCSLNEVGGDPKQFSISNEKFHKRMKTIYENFPNTMHTLSTHDTKRSLDARMRIHTLAELPMEFSENLMKWIEILPAIQSYRMFYFFIQNLIAISDEDIENRMTKYMIKSVREGKYYSDHLEPDLEYEAKMSSWITSALGNKQFLESFHPFKKKIVNASYMKSLSAIVLQTGLFGVMDIYQGEELLNANLVDPDNRRPIDFNKRIEELNKLSSLKMEVIHKGLTLRKKYRKVFQNGSYEPLDVGVNQVGYKRSYEGVDIFVIVNKYHYKPKSISMKDAEAIFSPELPFGIFIKK